MLNDGRWDKEAGVFQTRHPLESYPDNMILLDYRAAAVARVNRSVGLHAQHASIANMGIGLQLNAGHNPASVRNLFSSRRISISDHRRADFRQLPQFQRFKVVEKAAVLHRENSQIAIVPDVLHL